jgi:hypothetical protein
VSRPLRWALAGAIGLLLLAHPAAIAADVWGNVGPASQLAAGGIDGRYPLGNYALDEHFSAVSAGVLSGIDVSGVAPMIAYFLANTLWQLTAFLANALITLFGFAFSLDLVNGSSSTGGAGALAPISAAIHSIYANVFGAPWLVLAVAVAGVWAMWRALVLRRYAETAGALALSLIYVVVALFFVAEPGQTIGAASKWTNQMSGAFLALSDHGGLSGQEEAKRAGADQLFELLVFQPWSVLEFGGTEHCVKDGASSGSEPVSVPVRPLAAGAGRDAALSRQLEQGTEVQAEGKQCINDAGKYAPHFLRFAPGTDERNEEYEALNDGDSSELPEADPSKQRGDYKLGPADNPATDAMEEGGQYQRLLVAVIVFVAELGAFCLLGALSVGVILAQVLLLLLLAFSPVALVAAVIPGRGHDFFKGWLQKLAGYLLRKAAYSLILAILLAVCSAVSAATSELGWLMSFGLQALFLWAVFLQRKTLTESLIGIATGPGAPGREGALRVLALYYGARTAARPLRSIRRSAGSATRGVRGRLGGGAPDEMPGPSSAAVSEAVPESAAPAAAPPAGPPPSGDAPPAQEGQAPKQGRPATEKARPSSPQPAQNNDVSDPTAPRSSRPKSSSPGTPAPPLRADDARAESPLSSDLRAEREQAKRQAGKAPPEPEGGSR